MKKNPKVNYDWFKEWGFVDKSFSFLRKGYYKYYKICNILIIYFFIQVKLVIG